LYAEEKYDHKDIVKALNDKYKLLLKEDKAEDKTEAKTEEKNNFPLL
jgi:hypothetical protein